MKYQVMLSARDADGVLHEIVIAKTDNMERAREGARQVSEVLPPTDRYFGGPVCFVMDEAGAIVD